ncbi:hypothetical protein BJ165DRAFT_1445422 [Panaeolus papilionaceus]|nr:hypothetical protein BJ165DRAFT_1445422 [Panaeolus papilionaceus]
MEPIESIQAAAPAQTALYLDLINIILSILISESDEKTRSKELSKCALICKDWCDAVQRTLFSHIKRLTVEDTPQLQELLSPSLVHDSSTPIRTFAKHVCTAKVEVTLDDTRENDEWEGAKDLIKLLRDTFPSNYQMQLEIRRGTMYSRHFSDLLSLGAPKSLVDLTLSHVTLAMEIPELACFVCDESLPSLKHLTVSYTVWHADITRKMGWEAFELDYNALNDARGEANPKATRSLDVLSYIGVPRRQLSRRVFFLHHLFTDLRVERFKLRNNQRSVVFLTEAPVMLASISHKLTELDLLYKWYEHELKDISATIRFHKGQFLALRTLKLNFVAMCVEIIPVVVSEAIVLSKRPGTEQIVADILSSLITPQLQYINIYIYSTNLDILMFIESPAFSTKMNGWIHKYVKWDVIDNALESLFQTSKGLSRVDISVSDTDWEFSKISEIDAVDLLEECLPKCSSQGVAVSYRVLPEQYFSY